MHSRGECELYAWELPMCVCVCVCLCAGAHIEMDYTLEGKCYSLQRKH